MIEGLDTNNSVENSVFEFIIDNTDLVIYMKDRNCTYTFINKKFEDLFGINKNEVIGKSDFDIFPFEVAEHLRTNDIEVIETGKSIEVDEKVTYKGDVQYYVSNKFPLHDKMRNVIGICGISTNITEMLNTKEQLETREEEFRTLVSNVQGVVYRCSTKNDWEMYYMSDYIYELSGYPASDFILNSKRSFASIIHPDDLKQVEDAVYEGLKEKKKYLFTYRIIRSDGEVRWVHEKGQGYYTGSNKDASWLDGVIVDITEEKLLQRKIQAQKSLFESKKMTAINTLIKGICHELGTPIGNNLTLNSYIMKALESLETGIKEETVDCSFAVSEIEEILKSLKHTISNIEREANIVDNLKMIAETQQSQNMKSIHAKSFFETIMKSLNMQHPEEDVDINISADEALYVQFVPGMIYQVMSVLYDNSMIHGFDAIHKGQIDIEVSETPNDILIDYKDNGKGIDAKVIERIQDPYFTTRMGLRSGLGLYTVFSIVIQVLGGHIQVSSEIGTGTTFRIELPKEDI